MVIAEQDIDVVIFCVFVETIYLLQSLEIGKLTLIYPPEEGIWLVGSKVKIILPDVLTVVGSKTILQLVNDPAVSVIPLP